MRNTPTFSKRPKEYRAAAAEAAGLVWLGEASQMVVKVHYADDSELVIDFVETARPTPEAARTAGQELARIHNAGAEAFGAPPPGWKGPNYIGRQEQECTPSDDWAQFYTQQRVLPFAHKARCLGHLSPEALAEVECACAALRAANIAPEPARLHGDLWSGNLLFGRGGPRIIDPAAHGGHRETDLAMLALFGAPYLEQIRAGYEEIHPLPHNWLAWTPVHQLHPLAVHAASHGPSYGRALRAAAQASLEVL